MSSSVDNDNKKKDILILGKGPADGIDDTTLTVEKEYSINFTEIKKKFYLSLNYNGSNSYLFVNDVKICKLKAEDSEINIAPLSRGNVSKGFLIDNMKRTGLCGYVYDFSAGYDVIVVDDILNIQKYLMKKHDIK